nr:immunoglobulin heavy chain junction region [Mus musculus]
CTYGSSYYAMDYW